MTPSALERSGSSRERLQVSLERLRRVPGVIGSFTCSALGELTAMDMPASYSREALEGAAARVSALLQAADESLDSCAAIRLAFGEHELSLRRLGFEVLCVLADRSADRRLLARESESLAQGSARAR